MRDIKAVLRGESRLGETQQVNRVEDVRLSLSVEPDEAVEFGAELQTRFADVAVVEDI